MSNENDRPVFILGAHKSGSSLLRNLLDGHPALFVVPYETHFFQMSHYWVDYRLRRARPPRLSPTQSIDEFIQLAERYNTITDSLSDSDLVGRFDMERMRSELANSQDQDGGALFLATMRAIHASLHGQALSPDLRIVEKSVENAEFALDLKHMFPGAKFIHVLRNPYANLVSLRRHVGRKGYPFLGPSLASLNNSYYHLYRNRRVLEDYLVISYEETLTQPEGTMRRVAAYLEIDYSEILLEPTSMGRAWKGNSSRGIHFSGISAENIDLWRKEINDLEINYITRTFRFLLDEYGYETLTESRSRFLPQQGESPRIYLLNRLLPFYL